MFRLCGAHDIGIADVVVSLYVTLSSQWTSSIPKLYSCRKTMLNLILKMLINLITNPIRLAYTSSRFCYDSDTIQIRYI